MKTRGYNSSGFAARNKVYMILFIAESFSERQHLVLVRSCFHPIQQLDRAPQHKEINQFAKVTQGVSDSFQIRPQEPLAPWMPRQSHMINRIQSLLSTPSGFFRLIFLFVSTFSKHQIIIVSHFSPLGRSDINLVHHECQFSLPPLNKDSFF